MNEQGNGIVGQGNKQALADAKRDLNKAWPGRWELTIAPSPVDKAHLGTHQLHLKHK